MLLRVLGIVADGELESRLKKALSETEAVSEFAPGGADFWRRVRNAPADLIVVCRALLPEPVPDSIQALRDSPDQPAVVVISDQEDAEERAGLLASGCYAVLYSGLADESLRDTLVSLLDRRQQEINEQLQTEVDEREAHLRDFDTKSPPMRAFIRMVRRVVHADSSLLILGETGVGKERLARAIHEASPRGDAPFVPVNCAAFPESLLEGELFGYVEGAFTGATGDRRGYFELAHGGTIFLDEIAEMARYVQVKLLRVLQERCIQRLGSEQELPIDVRIMAATNRDLDEEIRLRRFGRDLYYRLGVVTLEVPPLRERAEDVPELLDRYLEEFRMSLRRNVTGFSANAVDALCRYAWPGNVRELINVVERAVLLCEKNEITLADLPPGLDGRIDPHGPQSDVPLPFTPEWLPADWSDLPWRRLRPTIVNGFERAYLMKHLAETKGRIGETAHRTGLSTRTLYLMMKRQGLSKDDFRRKT